MIVLNNNMANMNDKKILSKNGKTLFENHHHQWKKYPQNEDYIYNKDTLTENKLEIMIDIGHPYIYSGIIEKNKDMEWEFRLYQKIYFDTGHDRKEPHIKKFINERCDIWHPIVEKRIQNGEFEIIMRYKPPNYWQYDYILIREFSKDLEGYL